MDFNMHGMNGTEAALGAAPVAAPGAHCHPHGQWTQTGVQERIEEADQIGAFIARPIGRAQAGGPTARRHPRREPDMHHSARRRTDRCPDRDLHRQLGPLAAAAMGRPAARRGAAVGAACGVFTVSEAAQQLGTQATPCMACASRFAACQCRHAFDLFRGIAAWRSCASSPGRTCHAKTWSHRTGCADRGGQCDAQRLHRRLVRPACWATSSNLSPPRFDMGDSRIILARASRTTQGVPAHPLELLSSQIEGAVAGVRAHTPRRWKAGAPP